MIDITDLKLLTSQMSVLYVEDEQELANGVVTYLKKIFHKVEHASNGKIGLEKASKNHYDIIISDIMMPFMNGLEMSRKIKELNPGSQP
jgi:DNA-binding response OmpR family regulator